MNHSSNRSFYAVTGLCIAGLMLAIPVPRAAAQNATDELAILRDAIKSDRTVVVAASMQLSEAEGTLFWPIYKDNQATIEAVNDGLMKLVLEYADLYPNVPAERAGQMLKEYIALEEKRLSMRSAYLKKVAKVLSPATALRLAQVENRLDLVVRLKIAGAMPLVPAKEKQQEPAVSPAK